MQPRRDEPLSHPAAGPALKKIDITIARLRLLLADVASRERGIEDQRRVCREQQNKLITFSMYGDASLDSVLTMMADVQERMAESLELMDRAIAAFGAREIEPDWDTPINFYRACILLELDRTAEAAATREAATAPMGPHWQAITRLWWWPTGCRSTAGCSRTAASPGSAARAGWSRHWSR